LDESSCLVRIPGMNIGKVGVYTGLKTIAHPNLDAYSGRKNV
jgi:hypothetical protein